MAADDIPNSMLHSARDELPEPLREALGGDLEWDRTLAALRGYSLIEVQGDGLRVHQLVQRAIREALSADQERLWQAAAIRFLAEGFPMRGDVPRAGRCAPGCCHAAMR